MSAPLSVLRAGERLYSELLGLEFRSLVEADHALLRRTAPLSKGGPCEPAHSGPHLDCLVIVILDMTLNWPLARHPIVGDQVSHPLPNQRTEKKGFFCVGKGRSSARLIPARPNRRPATKILPSFGVSRSRGEYARNDVPSWLPAQLNWLRVQCQESAQRGIGKSRK